MRKSIILVMALFLTVAGAFGGIRKSEAADAILTKLLKQVEYFDEKSPRAVKPVRIIELETGIKGVEAQCAEYDYYKNGFPCKAFYIALSNQGKALYAMGWAGFKPPCLQTDRGLYSTSSVERGDSFDKTFEVGSAGFIKNGYSVIVMRFENVYGKAEKISVYDIGIVGKCALPKDFIGDITWDISKLNEKQERDN